MNFYLCHGSVDMRKGIVSLSELVRRKMNACPENGDVFIFLGKDRRNLKILRHESNGYVLYWKKLQIPGAEWMVYPIMKHYDKAARDKRYEEFKKRWDIDDDGEHDE